MYVCAYMYTHVCRHVHAYMCACACTCTCDFVCAHVCACVLGGAPVWKPAVPRTPQKCSRLSHPRQNSRQSPHPACAPQHARDAQAKARRQLGAAVSTRRAPSARVLTVTTRDRGGRGPPGRSPPAPRHVQGAEPGHNGACRSHPALRAPTHGDLGLGGVPLLWAWPGRWAWGPEWTSYRLSVRVDAWFISLLAIKFLISEK